MRRARELNAAERMPGHTAMHGVTPFSDWTDEEIASRLRSHRTPRYACITMIKMTR